jgi:NACHT domain
VLFDCFGGGAYRSFADGRHRPERGLLHIVNDLACRGICDPILPGSSDSAEVVRRSLQRFRQAIEVLRRTRPATRLVLIIDAADNAALEADERKQPSFPRVLLETISGQQAIPGLVLIVTARTERRELALGRATCEPYQLEPFSLDEAKAFITARRPEAASAQIEVIRSAR